MTDTPVFSDAILPPTVERIRRGDVQRAERQISDVRGAVGDPFIVVSLLSRFRSRERLRPRKRRLATGSTLSFVARRLATYERQMSVEP